MRGSLAHVHRTSSSTSAPSEPARARVREEAQLAERHRLHARARARQEAQLAERRHLQALRIGRTPSPPPRARARHHSAAVGLQNTRSRPSRASVDASEVLDIARVLKQAQSALQGATDALQARRRPCPPAL